MIIFALKFQHQQNKDFGSNHIVTKNNGHTFDVTKPNALLHQIRKKIAAVGNWALAVAGLDANVIALVVAYRNEVSEQPP